MNSINGPYQDDIQPDPIKKPTMSEWDWGWFWLMVVWLLLLSMDN